MAGKYRETAQNFEVDLAAVEPEFDVSSQDLSPGGDLRAVVKADGNSRHLSVVVPSAALDARRFGVRTVGGTPLSPVIQKKVDCREFKPSLTRRAMADRIQVVAAEECVDFGCPWRVRRWGQLATIPGGAAGDYSVVVRTGRGSSCTADLPLSWGGYAWTS